MKDSKKSIKDFKNEEVDTNKVQGGKQILIDPSNEVNCMSSNQSELYCLEHKIDLALN